MLIPAVHESTRVSLCPHPLGKASLECIICHQLCHLRTLLEHWTASCSLSTAVGAVSASAALAVPWGHPRGQEEALSLSSGLSWCVTLKPRPRLEHEPKL